MKEKEFVTSDLWLASAIALLTETYPKFRVENRKVTFVFPANADIYRAISQFNSGIAINVYEYSQITKRLKSEMILRRDAMRDGGQR